MHVFGGVYADLDMESLKPIGPLLSHRQAALAWMGPPDDHPHNLPNAWMASEPGHPFWLMMLLQIVQAPKDQPAEHVTGPVALKRAVEQALRQGFCQGFKYEQSLVALRECRGLT